MIYNYIILLHVNKSFVTVGGALNAIDFFVVVNRCLIDSRCYISKTPSKRCLHWVRDLHTSKENAHTMF